MRTHSHRSVLLPGALGVLGLLLSALYAGCSPQPGEPAQAPVSLEVRGPDGALALGRELRLAADAISADGSRHRVVAEATWSSSDEAVIRVLPPPALPGTIRAVGQGEADLDVQLGVLRTTLHLQVGPRALDQVELELHPAREELAKGERTRATAWGHWSDGVVEDLTARADWSTSVPQVLAPAADDGPGAFIAAAEGRATLRAEVDGVEGAVELVVGPARKERLELDPPALTLAQGTQSPLTVSAIYTDATVEDVTAEVAWASSRPEVAGVVEGQAVLEGKTVGEAEITATLDDLSVSAQVTVTTAVLTRLDLAPSVITLPAGISTHVSAVGTFSDGTTQDLTLQVVWSTSDSTVLSLLEESPPGTVLAVKPGTAMLRASAGPVETAALVTVSTAQLATLEILPGAPVVQKTTTVPLQAAAHLTDGTIVDVAAQAQWTSSDSQVATVDPHGRVTGVSEGTATISASYQGKHPTVTLTVSGAPLSSLQVSAASGSLARGYAQPLTATGLFADGHSEDLTGSVLWTSSTPLVAAVSNAPDTRGTCTALAVGTATITASQGSVSASFPLTVTPAVLDSITLQPSAPSLPLGLSTQLHATGVFSDGTQVDLTRNASWSSSSTAVATVDPGGQVRGLQQGTTTITAAYGGRSGTMVLTVTPAVVVRVDPGSSYVPLQAGASAPLTATAVWSDGVQGDVTATAAWSSDDAGIASVSTQAGSEGVVLAQSVGITTVRATYAGFVAAVRVEVTP